MMQWLTCFTHETNSLIDKVFTSIELQQVVSDENWPLLVSCAFELALCGNKGLVLRLCNHASFYTTHAL